jgi:endonuclease YncB( thermonuclease family)
VTTLLCLALGAAEPPAWLELEAVVTDVRDGNQLRVVDGKGTVHLVRLAGCDAPELAQPAGVEARNRLRDLVRNKTVRIVHRYFDEAGRILGKVYADEVWVNEALVRDGLAWFADPDEDAPELGAVAREAQTAKTGLWRQTEPVPPWLWRRGARSVKPDTDLSPPPRVFPRSPSTNDRALIGGR